MVDKTKDNVLRREKQRGVHLATDRRGGQVICVKEGLLGVEEGLLGV